MLTKLILYIYKQLVKNVLVGKECGTNVINYGEQGVIRFDNTVYVPELQTNLLSVGEMT